MRFNIQDGLQRTSEWTGSAAFLSTRVVQMVENGFHAAQAFGNSLLLLAKLKKYWRKGDPHPLELVDDSKLRRRILRTVKATEGFVQLSVIAMGILQITSLRFSGSICDNIRYMRTSSKGIVSEATFMDYFRRHIFRILAEKPDLSITRIIRQQQEEPEIIGGLLKQ